MTCPARAYHQRFATSGRRRYEYCLRQHLAIWHLKLRRTRARASLGKNHRVLADTKNVPCKRAAQSAAWPTPEHCWNRTTARNFLWGRMKRRLLATRAISARRSGPGKTGRIYVRIWSRIRVHLPEAAVILRDHYRGRPRGPALEAAHQEADKPPGLVSIRLTACGFWQVSMAPGGGRSETPPHPK